MSSVEILSIALVLIGLYTTALQVRYGRLLKWASAAQVSLLLAHTILKDIEENVDEEPTDS